jgi:tRNA threonylcarbamoyladenosine modification (KEOPS) complex  Pcc1 subunit
VSIGASQDGHVQVAADGAGKKIDNAELVRDDAATVYRQRVVLGSDENPRQQVSVSGEAGRGVLHVNAEELSEIRATLQEIRDLIRMFVGT